VIGCSREAVGAWAGGGVMWQWTLGGREVGRLYSGCQRMLSFLRRLAESAAHVRHCWVDQQARRARVPAKGRAIPRGAPKGFARLNRRGIHPAYTPMRSADSLPNL
jgi:hypothetical protein